MTKTKDNFRGRGRNCGIVCTVPRESMAETLHVSFATVNRWENGWTAPSELALRQLRRIAPLTSDKG